MEKKYLSDCIRYTTDIAPYPFIQIYSGVGSGKNTFVDALAKGYEESQPDGRMETLGICGEHGGASCASPRAEPKLTS